MTTRRLAVRQAHRAARLTRKVYHFATVPRFRSRGASITATRDELRLLFRPATAEWFVEHEQRWYRPADDTDLALALTELAVEFIDEQLLRTIPHAGELVWVHHDAEQDTIHLDFYSSGGQFVSRVVRGEGDIPRDVVRWTDPVHDDGWVDLTAGLWAAGATDLTIEAYLPPHEQLGDKLLSIAVDRGGTRHTRTVVLTRGDPTVVPLFRGSAPAWGVRVGLHSQYPEPASDSRELGFQLVSIERRR